MCGITGLIALDAPKDVTARVVAGMASRIAHRGPDGGGVAFHPDATLAMTRLAIVDVERGAQPMANEDDSVVIVYNGEIYNAPTLRRELEREGVRFRTTSDTEVILRLYERDPDRVEEHLVGMWAFAIHDRRRKQVVFSRDRFGIKPLFIVDTGHALAFASELRCFDRSLAPFSKHFALDHAAAHAMVSWSYVPEDRTIFAGVRRLPPASRLVVDLTSHSRTERVYWRLTPSADAETVASLENAMVRVDELLRRAVHEHLESDVPVATLLSGGIDSSLITAYAHDASSRPLKAFAIGFEEQEFDESRYAQAAARALRVQLDVRMLTEDAARRSVPEALLAYDEPFGDSSSIATRLVCEQVAREFKVVLGGDGGDEVFAGYKKHAVVRMRRALDVVPHAREAFGRALAFLPVRTDRTRAWTEALRTMRRVSAGLVGSDGDAYTRLTQVASLALTAPLLRSPQGADEFVARMQARFDATPGTALQKTLTSDLAGPLVNDMLVKVDRASMACHLEARVPFLDHRVVEFGVGLPQRFSLGRSGKRVLRALHAKRFGPELANRKKQGFRVPVERWLRGPLDAACARMFERKRLDRYEVLSTEELSDGRYRAWVAANPVVLWHALALAVWCESELGDGPEAVRDLLAA